jgi:hypothetical protein
MLKETGVTLTLIDRETFEPVGWNHD